jgi:DNA repair protein RadC
METELHEHAGDCEWVVCREPRHAGSRPPYQLSFLSPIAGATAGTDEDVYGTDPGHVDHTLRLRRRRCRNLKPAEVDQVSSEKRALLRKPTGEFIAPLYGRSLVVDAGGDVVSQSGAYEPADPDTIIVSAEALLSHRLRHGVKILRDPYLLLRFLRIRLVSQPMPVFAAFFLDRKQRLIRFAELTHGSGDYVRVYPKEVVRDTLECGAEQVLCVRSDPRGDHQPTTRDAEDARRVKYALSLIEVPLVDYVIVGESVTSLVHRRVI